MVIGHVTSIKDTNISTVTTLFTGGFVMNQSCTNRVDRDSCAQCNYVEAKLGLSLSTFAYHRLAE